MAKKDRLKKKCFIIAEAGSNHNGSLQQAKKMIDAAKVSGCDAIKFQIFRAKTMYPNKPTKVKYLKDIGIKQDLYSIIKDFEVPYGWIEKLHSYCKKADIEFMATPFDIKSVHLLDNYVNIFKIASYESLFLDLINEVKKTKKPLFISTGGSYEKEIDLLVDSALSDYKDKTVLLHCVARYPAPLSEINLKVLPYMAEKYGIAVGYSDHSADTTVAPATAVALGAKVIEKHFTLDRTLPGPDHAFALEPYELKQMVLAIRSTEKALKGSGSRRLAKCEEELYHYKRCLYSKKDLAKGHIIKEKDLVVLRNTGLNGDYFNPMEKENLLGRVLKRPKKASDIIMKGDVR